MNDLQNNGIGVCLYEVHVGAQIRGQNGTIIVNCDLIKCVLSTAEWWIIAIKGFDCVCVKLLNVPVIQ